MKVLALTDLVEKWNARASVATDDYARGVRDPAVPWIDGARSANENWKAAISAAVAADLFIKGINRAGNEKWQQKTLIVGVPRWPQGIAIAKDSFAKGFGPFHEALTRLTLPKRYPKGDPRNIDRVSAIAKALHSLKTTLAK